MLCSDIKIPNCLHINVGEIWRYHSFVYSWTQIDTTVSHTHSSSASCPATKVFRLETVKFGATEILNPIAKASALQWTFQTEAKTRITFKNPYANNNSSIIIIQQLQIIFEYQESCFTSLQYTGMAFSCCIRVGGGEEEGEPNNVEDQKD